MRKAVIDLGSNTFNLLIASVQNDSFEVLFSDKEGVSIGMGGINQRMIIPDAFERGMACLERFKAKCDAYEVDQIIAFGTSAIRDAKNGEDFKQEAWDKLRIPIEIIDGEREAELIYQGVKWSYDFEAPAVIMDIGGGSTEFIFADKNGIIEKASLDIGILRLYNATTFNDPYTEEDIIKVKSWLDEKSGNYFNGKSANILIGASGTFETFYELVYKEPFTAVKESIEVDIEALLDVTTQLIHSTEAERDTNELIIPVRKKMAPITSIKVQWILEKLGIERVFISPCSLKEGGLSI